MIFPQQTINCGGRLLDLSTPRVMGVINVTPDSFYAQSRKSHLNDIIEQAESMLNEGVDILDIGGMSSRPGAAIVSSEEEYKRVIPPIEALRTAFPEAIISIDTVHSGIAKAAVIAGASMVNDISAGKIDPQMYDTVASLNVPYVLMHMRGKPKNMQRDLSYHQVVQDILDFLIAEIAILREKGIKDIIIDPGFGFGKSVEQNYELLKGLHLFKILEVPLLVGLSRKSMIYKLLNTTPGEALNGTSVAHLYALQGGARILRTHDVRAAKEVITIWQQMEKTIVN